jgi:hypothetical protein
VTLDEIAEVRPRLLDFTAEMLGGLARKDQRAAGELYVRGLLTDGRRKSMVPMAERIRQDRAEAARYEQLVSELEAAGITVTDGLPDGAARLAGLVHDGADLTAEAHAGCPGRGAYFQSWNLVVLC